MATVPPNPHPIPQTPRGRGSSTIPSGRFEPMAYAPEYEDLTVEDLPEYRTQYFKDHSKSIISTNDSPDVHFDASINPYRGCEHGCVYCYARPTHEYLGLSPGLDFETKIFVKENAPELLKNELSSKKWVPKLLGISGVTDCYQPIEKELKLTRGCLEVLTDFRNPVGIITKNHLVTRDIDLLKRLRLFRASMVYLSLTTLDEDLRRKMEPRTASVRRRIEAIAELADAGVPVGAILGPVIPGLNDSEIPALLEGAARAGAKHASYIMLRLPYGISDLFETWLQEHFPSKAGKVMHHVREMRGGKTNDSNFKTRMRGQGPYAEQIAALFRLQCKRLGLNRERPILSAQSFRRPGPVQLSLF
ncbi:MAG: PA0069 family radical SAM protein [Candidatus Omnitrophica bacterium]|nr:PA0069 family radical SAM protein [Candidatus Omnitrophota bacterium]